MPNAPWVEQAEDLASFLNSPEECRGERILVTRPQRDHRAQPLPIGAALRAALLGPTRSLTMLVGFFSDGARGDIPEDSPLGLIRSEAAEELAFPGAERSADGSSTSEPQRSAFRLLFGALAGDAAGARLALTSFWWLCRWRKSSEAEAEAWRIAVRNACRARLAAARISDAKQPAADVYTRFAREVFADKAGTDVLTTPSLPLLDPDESSGSYTTFLQQLDTTESKAFIDWRDAWSRETKLSSVQRTVAAVLTLFFVLRRGHLRLQAVPKDKTASGGLFHGKLYVIERMATTPNASLPAQPQDTVVVMGSPNWSTGALFGAGSHANTEIAAIGRTPGWPWDPGAISTSTNLSERLTRTARELFQDENETCLLARWGAKDLPTITELEALLAAAEKRGKAFTEPEQTKESPAPPLEVVDKLDDSLQPLAHALLQLIERSLGITNDGSPARRYLEEHLARVNPPSLEAGQFAAKRIQAAQSDGAIRLIELLRPRKTEDGPGYDGRGAFLSDEAGLGKSVVAQMVAFGLILEKALDKARGDDEWPRVTILAPRQLVVSEVGSRKETGQWQGHRTELIDELLRAVNAMLAIPEHPDTGRLERVLAWLTHESKAPDGQERRIRVFSHSTFHRELSNSKVLQDHAHIAASEVVILDESHNLRNGSSSRTRFARFLLSLPTPGETWPLFLGDSKRKDLLSGTNEPPPKGDPRARRVICLTATPFNNAFDDLVTQIGHFGRAQAWPAPDKASPKQTVVPTLTAPLPLALKNWCDHAKPGAILDVPHMEAFRVLVEHLAGERADGSLNHLKSGRRLDPDPQKAEMEDGINAVRDGGPTYVWPENRYPQMDAVINVVSEALTTAAKDDNPEEPLASPPDAKALLKSADAMSRLDGLLGHLFVQRSRARIIRLMPAAEASNQFRAPHLPRMPLALNDDNEHLVGPERDILARLFTLDDGGPGGLSLLSYTISTLRAESKASGSAEQKSTNLLGFQRMQLIKRLQSSRYSFLQTVLRGPLRRSLAELALLESLMARPKNAVAPLANRPADWHATAQGVIATAMSGLARCAKTPAHRLLLALALRQTIDEAKPPKGLCEWVVGIPAQSPEVPLALLGKAGAKRVAESLGKDATPKQLLWLERLLEDVGKGDESQLLSDVSTCLAWSFNVDADPSKNLASVVPALDPATMAALTHDIQRSGGSRGLFSALRRHLTSGQVSAEFLPRLLQWLRSQLLDRRFRGVVGWLLAQAAADSKGVAPASGNRTLVFSEYADTVDHLGVVLQCLSICAEAELAQGTSALTLKSVGKALHSAVADTVGHLYGQTEKAELTSRQYVAPIPEFKGLFSDTDSSGQERRLLELAARLATFAGIRTGEGAARLRDDIIPLTTTGPTPAGDDDESFALDLQEDGSDDDDSPATANQIEETDPDAALVDAFAPWYRIDIKSTVTRTELSAKTALAAVERMDSAARRPLRVLLATEVLSEGVNLQDCGVVVHFDLPWNPTRLIQRNGRVDRRIEQAYEDRAKRTALWSELRALAEPQEDKDGRQNHQLAEYTPPQQVYHLTVVPPEPVLEDDALAKKIESVRRTLFKKLRSIQLLFGLSSWPIILRRKEAKAVLSGELEVETPGFRRREQLFTRRADLLARLNIQNPAPFAGGSVCLTVPAEDSQRGWDYRGRLAKRLGGPAAGPAWEAMDEAGVQVWSSAQLEGAEPVRSGPEWRPQTHAITAWASLLATGGEDSGPRLLRWARAPLIYQGAPGRADITRRVTVPALIQSLRLAESGLPVWYVYPPQRIDPTNLLVTRNPVLDLRAHPLSPTDAAEEVLDEVAEWLLTQEVLFSDMVMHSADDGVPTYHERDCRRVGESGARFLIRAWQEAGAQAEVTSEAAPEPIHGPGVAEPREALGITNLRVVFISNLSSVVPT